MVALIAIQHFLFLIIEIFFWTRPLGRKIFQLDKEFSLKSANLAANQGLYNGFLSAGLLWSLLAQSPEQAVYLKLFFLGCVALAGIFGAFTVSKKILWIQGVPALLTLALIILFHQ